MAGAIMVTDGQVHDVPATAAALGFNAPLHALITGKRARTTAASLVERRRASASSASAQNIDFRVTDTARGEAGAGQGRRHPSTASRPRGACASARRTRSLSLDHAGRQHRRARGRTAPGELTDDNNRAVAMVDGVRENLRVLLVSGEPHAGERTWRNVLKSDAAVDLVHFTILRPPEKQDGTPINELSLIAFPTRELFEEKIDEFDLIIFDRYQRRGVLPIALFRQHRPVRRERRRACWSPPATDYASPRSLYRTPLGRSCPRCRPATSSRSRSSRG